MLNFNPRIILDGEELAVSFGGHEVWRLRWDDVVEVAIWREDASGGGSLCVGLRVATMKPGEYLGVSESADGFATVLEEIDRRFDNAYAMKWQGAVFPPMATQWTVVYGQATGRAELANVVWPEAA